MNFPITPSKDSLRLAVIGLGYVGLPLAVEFGKIREVIGFDTNNKRIEELRAGIDTTLETTGEELQQAKFLNFTISIEQLRSYNCYIVSVPTPNLVKSGYAEHRTPWQ